MYESDKYKRIERPYKEEEDIGKTEMLKEIDSKVYEARKARTNSVVEHHAVPRMTEDVIEPLNIISSDVIGNIFDRVKFLEQRINEIGKNVEIRKQLHDNISKEIDKDIDDKNNMSLVMSDPNERRNLKLDISVLRKEKRHEDVQFWKDVMELNTELKQLTEQHETERKIASIFKELDGE